MKNSVTISAQAAGKMIVRVEVPASGPRALFDYITKQALPALMLATQRKQPLVMVVCPVWKVWVIRYILRAGK